MSERAIVDSNNGAKVYPPFFWTEERVERLRRLTSGTLTASAIAQSLGCTKNMVIGKCERAAITLPNSRTVWRTAPPTPNPFPARGRCLWGVGNPGEPGFHFCGVENAPGNRNYCHAHAARARPRNAVQP